MVSTVNQSNKYGSPWSRNEVALALALYKATGSSHDEQDPEIQELARLIGRTPGSVIFKLGNLKAVETEKRAGFSHTAPMDRQVWREFQGRDEELYQEAEKIRNETYSNFGKKDEDEIEDLVNRLNNLGQVPSQRTSQVLVRQKQEALRRAVLSNYEGRCSFCDVNIPEMLVAAHIHGWNKDVENRLNLSNTLCLCVLHHCAFDNGFLSVSDDGRILVSPQVRGTT